MKNLEELLDSCEIDSILVENQRSRWEACQFLLHEIKIANRKYCKYNKVLGNRFNRQMIVFTNLAKTAVEKLVQSLNANFSLIQNEKEANREMLVKVFTDFLMRFDDSLFSISAGLQDVANSITYRRYKPFYSDALFQKKQTKSKVRLSEVHLDFADTYRGIYSLVVEYFDCLKRGFLEHNTELAEKISHPVLVVSHGQTFSLEEFCSASDRPVYLSQKQKRIRNADELNDFVGYLFGFSRILSPRYFPVMIRYAPLLSHELAHLLIRFCKSVSELADLKKYDSDTLEAMYGKSIIHLSGYINKMSQNIKEFLYSIHYYKIHKITDEEFDYKVVVNYLKHPDTVVPLERDPSFERAFKRRIRNNADNYTEEIISDIYGVLVCKQSYVAAFLFSEYLEDYSNYFQQRAGKPMQDKGFLSVDHPPSFVRIEIILYVAEKIGFTKFCSKLRDLQRAIRESILENIAEFNNLVGMWQIWIERTKSIVDEVIKTYSFYLDSSDIFTLCQTYQNNIPFYNEDKLNVILKFLAEKVEANDIYIPKGKELYDEFVQYIVSQDDDEKNKIKKLLTPQEIEKFKEMAIAPSDTIGAIWYRMIYGGIGTGSRKRLQDRLLLSKNFN